MIKVTLINTSDSTGGAAIACRRLFYSLKKNPSIIPVLIARDVNKRDDNIISTTEGWYHKLLNIINFAVERIYFIFIASSKSVRFLFSIGNTGIDISKNKSVKESDIIHLHWINHGFLSLKSIDKLLSLKKSVVWTLHDMWTFTGGCHYSGSCNQYINNCGICPFIKKPKQNDLSNKIWKRKKQVFLSHNNLTIVTCSQWLANCAKESSLLKNHQIINIPNPIDTNKYLPKDKTISKDSLNLNQSKRYILFAAVNINNYLKGFNFFLESLKILKTEYRITNEIEILIAGKTKPHPIFNEIPFKCIFLQSISEDDMPNIYNASDIYVTTSIQENLPNTIMESLSCGVPVVAFNIGGIPEMIDHRKNGWLALYKSAADIAKGIYWCLFEADYNDISGYAREKVINNYSESIVAQKYIQLYSNLLNKKIHD